MRTVCLVLLLLPACPNPNFAAFTRNGLIFSPAAVRSGTDGHEYLMYCGLGPDDLVGTVCLEGKGSFEWEVSGIENLRISLQPNFLEPDGRELEEGDVGSFPAFAQRVALSVSLLADGNGTGRFTVAISSFGNEESGPRLEDQRTFIVKPALRHRVAARGDRSITLTQVSCALVSQLTERAGPLPRETITELPAGGTRADANVAIDPDGNAAAIWTQLQDVYASYRPAGRTWQPPKLLQKEPPGELGTREPQIVMDTAGNAAAVWEQDHSVWAHAYRAGEGWDPGGARRVGDGRFPRAAMNRQGDLLIVATDGGVVRSHYFRGRNLDESDLADVGQRDPDDPPLDSSVALDDNGCGLAVIAGRASTQAYELDETGEWSERDTLATSSAMGFALDVTESKEAVVVWSDGETLRGSIYDSLGGFGETETLHEGETTAPSVSLRPDGRAIAIYGAAGAEDVVVSATQFIPDLGWSDPRAVGAVPAGPVTTDTDSDGDGTTVAVFGNDEESGEYEWRPPTAVIGVAEANPVVGKTADYSGTGSFAHGEGNSIVAYSWDFDADGTTESNDPVTQHIFAALGIQRVQLEVVDAWGMTGLAIRHVEVEADDRFFLEIIFEGDGEGTIDISPLGRQCSATCRIEVPRGTVIDMFPLAGAGSRFGRLAGCNQPGDVDLGLEGCHFTMNGNRTFNLRFERD